MERARLEARACLVEKAIGSVSLVVVSCKISYKVGNVCIDCCAAVVFADWIDADVKRNEGDTTISSILISFVSSNNSVIDLPEPLYLQSMIDHPKHLILSFQSWRDVRAGHSRVPSQPSGFRIFTNISSPD